MRGDKVEIRVLPDGESDPPINVSRSSESPTNLFSSIEQARLLLQATHACDKELMAILERARVAEPADELQKIQRAVGWIIYELDCYLISPTLRRHPELLAEAKAKKLIE